MNDHHITLELHKILEMLVNQCTNEYSKQLASEVTPSTDLDEVKLEVEKTFETYNATTRFGTPSFFNFTDAATIAKRAQNGSALSLRELLDISKMLTQVEALKSWRRQFPEEVFKLDYLFECLFENKWLNDRINLAVLNEEELADTASTELASIRRKLVSAGAKIRDTLDKMIKSSSTQTYLQESVVTMRDGRYVLPVKSEHKNHVPGLVHDTSASGQTFFIEPMAVVEANNEIRVLKGKEQDEIERIIRELSGNVAEFAEQIISDYQASALLNLYFAKANLGTKMNATMPEISDDGEIILRKARHPLIEADKVVPIDFTLGSNYDSLIITGPNTGGKTVTLKTVGLLTLMTMCGLMIPVSDGSKITVFEKILVDIGDQQSIEHNLSTFSSHMNRVVEILETVNYKSLVLIDELGSGTDPVEGAALAVSIIEKINSLGAKLVTTTHYQELKMYALETDGVENASCEFDVKTLRPTYRLIIGSPGKSNAFAISSRLGLSEEIIKNAQGMLSSESKRFEKILDNLEATRQQLEENTRLAEQYKREAETLRAELSRERDELLKKKEKELDTAHREARAIIDRISRQSQQLMDQLEELKKAKDKEDFSKLVAEQKTQYKRNVESLYSEAAKLGSSESETYVLPRPLKKGDDVLVYDSKKSGILISTPDAQGNCMVQVGIMKTKVHVSKLRLVEKEVTFNNSKIKPKGANVSTKGVESRATRKASIELDIRGMTVDEGLYELDTFIDNAVMSGNKVVTIIHGIGTGILKNAVRNHLRRHPSVASSRKGVYGEGEDGVTVVELK
ncbi:MAG: endonuclease MutS2 [Oscillospiraceae bacterium]|nr:endonuclease MutS2 [Oscillospiraceae bacterium]